MKQVLHRIASLSLGLCAMMGLAPAQAARPASHGTPKPNILFILLDDVGWGDVSYHGSEIQTPNIDGLAASGVKLERSYVFPICSPTRAALLSGRNPLRYGLDAPIDGDRVFQPDLTLLPARLKQAGYKTWMVGKWHLGNAPKAGLPNARGFDHFYGFLGGYIDYYTHVFDGGLDWQRNGTSVREEGHATELLTQETIRLISQHKGKQPFFLYLAYNAGHTPLQYVPGPVPDYANIQSRNRRVYAQMMTDLDAHIGRVLVSLKTHKLLSNTLIVLLSDNGGGAHLGSSNGLLRGEKGQSYEGGIRTPGIIAWQGVLRPGQTLDQPLFVQDWAPTLLNIAGVSVPIRDFDGRSVWPLIRGRKWQLPARPVAIGGPNSRAVISWPLKLVRRPERVELFNIELDPQEKKDLSSAQPKTVARMQQALFGLAPIKSDNFRPAHPLEEIFSDKDGNMRFDLRLPETRAPWTDGHDAEQPKQER